MIKIDILNRFQYLASNIKNNLDLKNRSENNTLADWVNDLRNNITSTDEIFENKILNFLEWSRKQNQQKNARLLFNRLISEVIQTPQSIKFKKLLQIAEEFEIDLNLYSTHYVGAMGEDFLISMAKSKYMNPPLFLEMIRNGSKVPIYEALANPNFSVKRDSSFYKTNLTNEKYALIKDFLDLELDERISKANAKLRIIKNVPEYDEFDFV